MIRHTVVFKLKHTKGSSEKKTFLDAALKLSSIPGAHQLGCMRQTSKKNIFDYCLSMEFETAKAYEAYNQHPNHTAFVKTYWIRDIVDFMEIDYEPMQDS